MSNVQVGQSVSNEGRIFVEEEGDDGAEGGCEEEEAGDGEENTGGFADEAGDTGDAGAGVGEDEAEECEAAQPGMWRRLRAAEMGRMTMMAKQERASGIT